MGVYKNLRNLYFDTVVQQVLRDSYSQLRTTIDTILSSQKNKLITALASLTISTNIASTSLAAIKNPFKPNEYINEVAAKLNSEEGRDILLNGLDITKPALTKKYAAPAYKPEVKDYEKAQPQRKRAFIVYNPKEGLSEGFVKTLAEKGIKVNPEEYRTPEKKLKEDFRKQLEKALYPAGKPWDMAKDLNSYRKHAVEQGSRNSAKNLEKSLNHLGLTIDDLANILTLAYHSDRAKQFTENDGKPLSFYLDEVGKTGGLTIVAVTDGVYSIADLVVLDLLPNIEKPAYQDNHPLVRPFVFTGSAMGYSWKTVENVGNVPTLGLFDNLTGSAGMCIEDIVESLKHTVEAGTNLTRGPIYLVFGKSKNLNKTLDWILLVPFEYVSNVIEMKGIQNMMDYKKSFKNKGVIASIAELGGSGYLVIRSVDEIVEELEHEPSKKRVRAEEKESEPPKPPYKPKPPMPGKIIIIEPRPPKQPFSPIIGEIPPPKQPFLNPLYN